MKTFMNYVVSMIFIFIIAGGLGYAKPNKSFWKKNTHRIEYYRSAKFKKKAHKRTQRNYKHACKYHNHFKEYKFGYLRYGERKHNFNFIKKLNFKKLNFIKKK